MATHSRIQRIQPHLPYQSSSKSGEPDLVLLLVVVVSSAQDMRPQVLLGLKKRGFAQGMYVEDVLISAIELAMQSERPNTRYLNQSDGMGLVGSPSQANPCFSALRENWLSVPTHLFLLTSSIPANLFVGSVHLVGRVQPRSIGSDPPWSVRILRSKRLDKDRRCPP